jgi:hypothetical protein
MKSAFKSVEEYNKFFEHVHGKTKRTKLIEEANAAISWGHADNESRGYSAAQFISLIQQLRDYIEKYT